MSGKAYADDPLHGETGRNAFREPDEPPDDRRLVIARRSFWRDASEALIWLSAADAARPYRKTDTLTEHLERIATIAGAELKGPALKQMPDARLPYPEDSE